jgi:hypothetical protein
MKGLAMTNEDGPVMVKEKKTLTERAVDWCFQQGTSTVLLLGLAGFLAWQAPKYLESNQQFTREIVVKFETEQQKTRDSFTALVGVMREEHRLDRESLRRSIREIDDHAKGNP